MAASLPGATLRLLNEFSYALHDACLSAGSTSQHPE